MKTLEDLASEAAETCGKRADYNCDRAWLERFAALVRAQALDEAAAACDDERVDAEDTKAPEDAAYNAATAHCAAAIRALKEST